MSYWRKRCKYAEFRLFDLNPFAPYGIELNDAKFIHYFFTRYLYLEEASGQGSKSANRNFTAEVALEDQEQKPLSVPKVKPFKSTLAMLEELSAGQESLDLVRGKISSIC